MSINEGVLGTLHFGGEHAHTNDHPPILLDGVKAAAAGAFTAGLLLAVDEDGALLPYTGEEGANTLAGVCDEPSPADATGCVLLVHGTVNSRLLTVSGGAAPAAADLAALRALGIWPM